MKLKKINREKGITLIALVVTIVVLLILAGVSINILFSDSGLIEKVQNASIKTRAAQVEEVVANWKQSNFINSSINKQKETADKMLEDLLDKKLVTEDEINREQEIITIKKSNGNIVKEISYSDVKIVISKTPENEKARAVKLKVESVKGMTQNIITEEELINHVKSLSDERKKEMIKINIIPYINKGFYNANCKTFEDVLKYMDSKKIINDETEDAFWNWIQSETTEVDGFTKEETFLGSLLEELYYDKTTGTIPGYTIINPAEQASSTYYATENGTYTFKVQDLITGKTYSKKVEVTNIDKTIQPRYEVISTVDEGNNTLIMLNDLIENKNVNFDKAYIIYDDRKIEISEGDIKKINENRMYVNGIYKTFYSFGFNNDEIEKVYNTTQTFILVKDGIEYEGQIYITEPNKY